MNWEIFKDHVFCINLEERPERLRDVSTDLSKIGLLSLTEFYKTKRSTVSGAVGCYISHVTVLRTARERGLKWALILEDDLLFDETVVKTHLDKLTEYLPQFLERTDWDMLFIGHCPVGAEKPIYQNGEFRVYRSSSTQTHGYIVNLQSSRIEKMIDSPLPTEDIIRAGSSIYHIDWYYSNNMRQYAIYPMMVFQRPDSPSDNFWGVIAEQFRSAALPEEIRISEALAIRYPFPVSPIRLINCIPHVLRLGAHKLLGNVIMYPLLQ
jgi:hypothetical protein